MIACLGVSNRICFAQWEMRRQKNIRGRVHARGSDMEHAYAHRHDTDTDTDTHTHTHLTHTHTRHTQHPFSMYRCLRKKVPIGIALLESLRPFPHLFKVGGVKRGVTYRLRKKVPFLRGRTCTAISSTLKTWGRGGGTQH